LAVLCLSAPASSEPGRSIVRLPNADITVYWKNETARKTPVRYGLADLYDIRGSRLVVDPKLAGLEIKTGTGESLGGIARRRLLCSHVSHSSGIADLRDLFGADRLYQTDTKHTFRFPEVLLQSGPLADVAKAGFFETLVRDRRVRAAFFRDALLVAVAQLDTRALQPDLTTLRQVDPKSLPALLSHEPAVRRAHDAIMRLAQGRSDANGFASKLGGWDIDGPPPPGAIANVIRNHGGNDMPRAGARALVPLAYIGALLHLSSGVDDVAVPTLMSRAAGHGFRAWQLAKLAELAQRTEVDTAVVVAARAAEERYLKLALRDLRTAAWTLDRTASGEQTPDAAQIFPELVRETLRQRGAGRVATAVLQFDRSPNQVLNEVTRVAAARTLGHVLQAWRDQVALGQSVGGVAPREVPTRSLVLLGRMLQGEAVAAVYRLATHGRIGTVDDVEQLGAAAQESVSALRMALDGLESGSAYAETARNVVRHVVADQILLGRCRTAVARLEPWLSQVPGASRGAATAAADREPQRSKTDPERAARDDQRGTALSYESEETERRRALASPVVDRLTGLVAQRSGAAIERHYQEGRKWLAFFGTRLHGIDLSLYMDMADIAGVSREGQRRQGDDAWVTVWVDAGTSVSLSLLPVAFGFTQFEFKADRADARPRWDVSLGQVTAPGFVVQPSDTAAGAASGSDGSSDLVNVDLGTIGAGASAFRMTRNVLRFELRKEAVLDALQATFGQMDPFGSKDSLKTTVEAFVARFVSVSGENPDIARPNARIVRQYTSDD
jgi:hypothetical protein